MVVITYRNADGRWYRMDHGCWTQCRKEAARYHYGVAARLIKRVAKRAKRYRGDWEYGMFQLAIARG